MITTTEIIIESIGIFLGLCYVSLICMYCIGWLKTPPYKINISAPDIFVSVIIAARNEETNITTCLQSLLNQTYSKNHYEIIVVDDHSSDATFQLVSEFAQQNNSVKIIQLPKEQTGKKSAIELGIELAKGEIIATTDADCIMGNNWLITILSFIIEKKCKMVAGPVDFIDEKNILVKFHLLESMALIASGAGSLYFNKSIMCNGANLMYYKNVFYEVEGYENLKAIASGDDTLLMYKIEKLFPKQIAFVKSKNAMVYTNAKNTLKDFYAQRKRWASKPFSLLNTATKISGIIILLFNSCILIMMIITAFSFFRIEIGSFFNTITFALWGTKWLVDFLLLSLAVPFFNKKKILIYFIPQQAVYSLYILIVGIFGSFGQYEWKGRKIKL